MTVPDKKEKFPKQVINKGDLKTLQNVDSIKGIVVGSLSGGAVGAVSGAITGAVVGLLTNDVINAIEDDLGIEEYSKADIKLF